MDDAVDEFVFPAQPGADVEPTKDLGKSQMQLGSGVRVIDPSDDPRTATEITRLQTSIRKLDSYQDTIQDLEIRMSIQDNVLKNVGCIDPGEGAHAGCERVLHGSGQKDHRGRGT